LAYRGQHEHSLDAKDRLTIPARWRGPLSDGVVLFEELDPCVSIYSTEAYEALTSRYVASLNPLSASGRKMRRRFHANAHDESLDSAGRVRVPRHLIEHAALEGTCVVIGVDDHIEVWNPDRWAEHDAEIDAQTERMSEELATGGAG
jgi:MraZ protein